MQNETNNESRALTAGPQNGVGRGFALALNPETAEQAMKCAEWMSKSDLIPKAFKDKPHDIVIASAMGARLGLDPFSAMAGIAVVNGRPALWGDAMLAVCQQRPDWGGMRVEWSGKGEDLEVSVTVIRKGQEPYQSSFSIQDAKTAGLWKKAGPWSQYPRRMLELRARAFALRSAFADALAGFHAREEMEDGPQDAEFRVVPDRVPEPKPAKRRPIKPVDVPAQEPEPEPAQEHAPEPETTNDAADIMREDDYRRVIEDAKKVFGEDAKALCYPLLKDFNIAKSTDARPEDRRAIAAALHSLMLEYQKPDEE